MKRGNIDNFFRKTLIKIDLSNENLQGKTIGKSVLRLYANKTEDCNIIASGIDDNWTESGVTWATAPVTGNDISTAEISAKNTYYEWDITNYIKSQVNQDGIVSLILEERTGAGADVYFNSKEAAGNHPELVIGMDDSQNSVAAYKNEISLNIYPNPAKSVLNVATAEGKIDKLSIYSLTGQLLSVQFDIENRARFNIEHLEEGIYLLRAEGDFGTYTVKFIKN